MVNLIYTLYVPIQEKIHQRTSNDFNRTGEYLLSKTRLIVILFFVSVLAPGIPRDLAATNITSIELNVTWSEPLRSNGILKNYTVYYKLIKHDNNSPAHGAVWKTKQTPHRTVTLPSLGKFAFGTTP